MEIETSRSFESISYCGCCWTGITITVLSDACTLVQVMVGRSYSDGSAGHQEDVRYEEAVFSPALEGEAEIKNINPRGEHVAAVEGLSVERRPVGCRAVMGEAELESIRTSPHRSMLLTPSMSVSEGRGAFVILERGPSD